MRGALLFLLCVACPAGLEPQTHVSKLRVLGVKAEPPELILDADAGLPSTTLTALAVDPSQDAGIAMRFALCADLSGVPSPTLDCPGDAGLDLPGDGALAVRLDLADPRIAEFAASAPFDGGTDIAAALDKGVPLLIGFTASTATTTTSGFATLTLRTPANGPAASNPHLIDLEIPDAGPGQTVTLQPIYDEEPGQRYVFSFFTTDGSLAWLHSTNVTATGQTAPTSVDWTAPSVSGATVHFWVVVRDAKGGTDWLQRDARLR